MIMQLVVLFQVKFKMKPFVHENDSTIADVHDWKINMMLQVLSDDNDDDDSIARRYYYCYYATSSSLSKHLSYY